MKIFSRPKIKYQPAKWLPVIIMLLSIFTFAGFSGRVNQNYRQAVKTEIALSKTIKVVKLSISYKRGIELCCHQHPKSDIDQNVKGLSYTYTRLVKVKLNLMMNVCLP